MQNLFPLHQYQKDLVDKLKGYKPGELVLFTAGRQLGKSYVNQMYMNMVAETAAPSFIKDQGTLVDGVPWYVVKCKKEVAAWIRTQDTNLWYEHIDSQWFVYKDRFDVHEKLVTMISIKFGP